MRAHVPNNSTFLNMKASWIKIHIFAILRRKRFKYRTAGRGSLLQLGAMTPSKDDKIHWKNLQRQAQNAIKMLKIIEPYRARPLLKWQHTEKCVHYSSRNPVILSAKITPLWLHEPATLFAFSRWTRPQNRSQERAGIKGGRERERESEEESLSIPTQPRAETRKVQCS